MWRLEDVKHEEAFVVRFFGRDAYTVMGKCEE